MRVRTGIYCIVTMREDKMLTLEQIERMPSVEIIKRIESIDHIDHWTVEDLKDLANLKGELRERKRRNPNVAQPIRDIINKASEGVEYMRKNLTKII